MYAGKIVEKADTPPCSRIRATPTPPGCFIRFRNSRPKRAPASDPGMVPDALTIPPGCPFHPRCPFTMERLPQRNAAAVELHAASRHPAALVGLLVCAGQSAGGFAGGDDERTGEGVKWNECDQRRRNA